MLEELLRNTKLIDRTRTLGHAALARVAALPIPPRVQRFAEDRVLPGAQRLWSRLRPLAVLLQARWRSAVPPTRVRRVETQPTPAAAVLLHDVLKEASQAPSWQARLAAVRELGAFRDASALDALIEARHDPSVEVASGAIEALGCQDAARARAALRDVLDDDSGRFHPLTRSAAVFALSRGNEAGDQARVRAAVRDPAAEVSLAAIAVIGSRRAASDLNALSEVVHDPTGYFLPTVRMAAQQALDR
jgi:HEAT repeat protein